MPFTRQTIPLKNTGLFSELFEDYTSNSENTKPFFESYIYKTDIDLYLKKHGFDQLNRTVLESVLKKQAKLAENTSTLSLKNISLLKESNTFTVTTGHQLCLFTGPLYFIYKIISTINLCKSLAENFPGKQFVPVYWMASEDHDFDEINHINVFGKKVVWNSTQKGSVGEFGTEGLQEVIAELKIILGDNENSTALIQLFESAYLKHSNLADATRYLVNELFGEYGLVILDGNDHELKALFKDEFTKDAFENTPFRLVNESIDALTKHYSAQVNPREINIFYKEKGLRERIERRDNDFVVLNTDIRFTEQELKNIIEHNPEKLSPNVVLRPLYQQKILPNVAYIGGPGELAYWLEYKSMFNELNIDFPILIPRNFVTVIDKGTQNKILKLDLDNEAVFKEGEELVKQFIKTQHDDINLEKAKQELTALYASVTETISAIDKTLVATSEAEKQKAINGLSGLEQKINRALKQKSETDVNQIWAIKGKLFPNNIPQERYDNFSAFYSRYGNNFIKELAVHLAYNLNDFEYTILVEN
jgi:bacillithiol biosynthesis cysteine-adding enzyme BshC